MTTTDNSRADALTDAEIEKGWHQTFSTSNPCCPCNLKSFTKAVRWAEYALSLPVEQHEAAPAGVHALDCAWIQLDSPWAQCTCGVGSPNNPTSTAPSAPLEAAPDKRVSLHDDLTHAKAVMEGRVPLVLRDPLKGTGNRAEFIYIVFDGPPSHQSGHIVEVEDDQGRSFNAGQWIDRGNGLWALRIARAPRTEVAGAVQADRAFPAKNGYFVYDPEGNGFDLYDTDAERAKAHNTAIEECRRAAIDDGEWPLEVDSIVSGVVTHKTAATNVDGDSCEYAAAPSADAAAAPADERAAFEVYMRARHPHVELYRRDVRSSSRFGQYCREFAQEMWELWQARAAASQPAAACARTTNDRWWDQALHERDTYEEYADELTHAIAAYLHIDIGENSNFNNPWLKALEAIKNAAPPAQVATRQEFCAKDISDLRAGIDYAEAMGYLKQERAEQLRAILAGEGQ